MSYISFKSF